LERKVGVRKARDELSNRRRALDAHALDGAGGHMIRKAYSRSRVACAVQPAEKRGREDIARASGINLSRYDACE
jgi:hypothetical protein